MQIENTKLTGHDGDVDLTGIAPAGITYLLQYGLSKSLQDSVSGNAKVLADAYGAANPDKAQMAVLADAFEDLGEEPNTTRSTGDFVAAVVKVRKDMRLAAILAGTVGTGGPRGPKLSKIEQIMRDVAIERIAAAVKAHGKPMPKDSVLKDFVAKVLEKAGDSIREEAERRMGIASKTANDLTELFG